MFEKNSYILNTFVADGNTQHYVYFIDGQGIPQKTEVTQAVYEVFEKYVKTERNLKRWAERHVDFTDISDETLYWKLLHPPKSVEEIIIDKQIIDMVRETLENLPKTQSRRFTLYYEYGFTYQEIAEMEGCTKRAVKFSTDLAMAKIREKIKKF